MTDPLPDREETMSELRPCPFCGDPGSEIVSTEGNWPAVKCDNCGAQGPCISIEVAGTEEQWNRRAPSEIERHNLCVLDPLSNADPMRAVQLWRVTARWKDGKRLTTVVGAEAESLEEAVRECVRKLEGR